MMGTLDVVLDAEVAAGDAWGGGDDDGGKGEAGELQQGVLVTVWMILERIKVGSICSTCYSYTIILAGFAFHLLSLLSCPIWRRHL